MKKAQSELFGFLQGIGIACLIFFLIYFSMLGLMWYETHSSSCKNFVSEILPETVEIEKVEIINLYIDYKFPDNYFIWKDGTKDYEIGGLREGKYPDENKNHLYSSWMWYSKEVVNEEGIIQEPIEIRFSKLEFEVISETPTDDPNKKKIEAKIVNYELMSCEV